MKHLTHTIVTTILLMFAAGADAQGETYQVPGFPPFAPDPTMLEVVEDRGDTVVVRHLMGETEIPKNPQRIVTADLGAFEMVRALDFSPVATFHWGDAWPEYLEPVRGETQFVRHNLGALPDLEAVLALQPDLIVASSFLGTLARYWVTAAGLTWIVDVPSPGETVYEGEVFLEIPPERVHVLRADDTTT
jgi:ABC-type enterochelin transport system substrate-binding protein